MRSAAVSYLALFLATACPILCRASMALAGDKCADESVCSHSACTSEATAGQDDSCPQDEPTPSAPADPCKELSCFCSPYVMIERDAGATPALSMTELPTSACWSVTFSMPCAVIRNGFFGQTALPVTAAEASAALPLLI